MKKILYILFALLVLSACSEDTTEYLQQKEEIEKANAEKKKELERLKQRLEELEAQKNGMVPEPQLLTMEFKRADNAGLTDNITCEVYSSTGVVNCWLTSLDDPKTLIPRFTFEGTLVLMGSTEVTSGSTAIDF